MPHDVIDLQVRRHLLEQIAYEEIRHYLSQQFLYDPVIFMQEHGKRPEDLNGAYLRAYYTTALETGIEARQSIHNGFETKFNSGKMFGHG